MKKPLLAAVMVVLLVAGCAGIRSSRLNPFNWFGGSSRGAPAAAVVVPAGKVDTRVLVDTVESLSVEQVPGGAIVHATGLSPTQGWYNAALVAEDDGVPVKGVLTYRFLVMPPPVATRVSTPQSRQVTVAAALSRVQLEGVRQITVTGARNSRSSRR